MQFRFILGLILILLLGSCETDPIICVDSNPKVVIFGVINSSDSVHYLKIGRTFGAKSDPYESAKIGDSLYFQDVSIEINKSSIPVERVTEIPKNAGIFLAPDQVLYRFSALNPYRISVQVNVPGLPEASAQVNMVHLTRINSPKEAQMYLYLVPDSPIRIQWDGNPWNEIDVSFEFVEFLDDTTRSQFVHIQNKNYDMSSHSMYRELSITYEEFLAAVNQQLIKDADVKKRQFGNIRILINGGDINMVNYLKYYNGYTDFNNSDYSNITNGLGLLASRCSFVKDSMHFDYDSMQGFLAEVRLRYLKLDPYQGLGIGD